MIFNVNDFFHAQTFHLVVTHDVFEAVHLAALRTLSEKHPVMIILERLMLQGFSSRVRHWDQLFYVNNIGDYVTNNWPTRGVYQGGYLGNDFQAPNEGCLRDVLTHFGFIVSVIHYGLNGGDPVGFKATLPFHLNAMYASLLTEKGVTDLLLFLVPAEYAVHYIVFIATFNRLFYWTLGCILEYVPLDELLLERFNKETRVVAADFGARMNGLSIEIRTRDFDEKGLGMPFIYRTSDPGYAPYFSAV
ncbi:hypothetical protein DL766_008301 [Monosporascus sp. MC13-8B]|uniref:Uncharacterized protein n=1 Tax=Monosporascus cannonballus TaxID=155416 RepID=A0ABY0H1W6_9PEZI|nr:hypothetical protein DL762_007560 [Monosporascus cannonballus]RYO99491.1 hypothetical protein DL763_001515 [Monosporascus cannonballus]RYP20026.1 hypothetical protein DL766_008301 [Monosporascus sp. MC13-8B]